MRILFTVALTTIALAATIANAQVTGVVTSTTATVTFRQDAMGNNILYNYSGDQIAASNGDNSFGSAGKFAATSKVIPGSIAFQNGNASAGAYAYMTSQTDVAVTITNNSAASVTPQFQSQILPAGLGVYVAFQCLADLTSCPEYTGPRNFQSFYPGTAPPTGDNIAGSSIDFRVLSDGVTIYDLTASVDLVYDPSTGTNVFVDNIAAAQATLNGFQLETAPGSQTQYGFNWQATDLDVGFPTTLAPSQSATLTYQTTVQTYSRADCFNLATEGCLIAYSSLGDPIGGGMGIKPGDAIVGLSFQSFALDYPTFQDGVLSLPLGSVPEPAAWVLTISGIASIGAILRRRRRVANWRDWAPQSA